MARSMSDRQRCYERIQTMAINIKLRAHAQAIDHFCLPCIHTRNPNVRMDACLCLCLCHARACMCMCAQRASVHPCVRAYMCTKQRPSVVSTVMCATVLLHGLALPHASTGRPRRVYLLCVGLVQTRWPCADKVSRTPSPTMAPRHRGPPPSRPNPVLRVVLPKACQGITVHPAEALTAGEHLSPLPYTPLFKMCPHVCLD